MKIKNIFCIILACLLVLCCCSCKKDNGEIQKEEQETAIYTVNLLHCANDTYNPYTLTSKINAEICSLLYDSLYVINNSFEPIPVLANNAKKDGNTWYVSFKNAKFSDSSPLTAEDIIYSFNLAKNCARYSTSLSHVSSVTANGKELIFKLKYNDEFFINVLTFPILKAESDKLYNADNVLLPPIGTGEFVLNQEESCLDLNKNYFGKTGKVKKIFLKNAPDIESVSHYASVGATDFYYADTSEGSFVRMTAKKATVSRNVLVYLGLNDYVGILNNVNLRYAISAAISRQKIVTTAFYSNATAATGPFHPNWQQTKDSQNTPSNEKKEISIENLNKIGYNVLNAQGYFVNQSGDTLELSLLVNSESPTKVATASLIAASLKEVGIKINIRSVPYERYVKDLQNGNFQLYLGEVKIDNNFDISALVLPGGKCAYGKRTADSYTAVSAQSVVTDYLNSKATFANVITALQSEMPFIPICYRNGIVFYNESLEGDLEFFENDLFNCFNNLTINNQ